MATDEHVVASEKTKEWIGAVTDEWAMYSGNPVDYTIGQPIGFGASSIVYNAHFRHPETKQTWPVALKVVDLERLPQSALMLLTRETQVMSLSKHPHVLRVRGTWVENRKLYIALRLMQSGSISDVMRYKFPAGVEEEVARCILKQALEGLNYLHVNGLVHRDIKAANLLLDDDGTVLVGDLGVAASLSDEDAHNHAANIPLRRKTHGEPLPPLQPFVGGRTLGKRKSFVGTPCWMAPEVIAQKQYDASADIWSLGITALELCNGRAPHSRDTPSRILQKILHNDPPKLDRKAGNHRYSQEFKEIIESCLVKDPSQRPTAAQLLETQFFKGAKKKNYLVSTLIVGLPPLTARQERRKQPSIISNLSADSWDFASTIHLTATASPTHSLNPQPASPNRAHPERVMTLPDAAVFEMEEKEERGYPNRQIGTRSPSSPSNSRASSASYSRPAMMPRTVSISEEENIPESDPTPSTTPHLNVMPEVVSKSVSSSSSSSNPVGPATPPSNAPSSSVPGSGRSGSTNPSIWKRLTGKSKDGKEKDTDLKRVKSQSRTSSLVGALLERTTSRK